MSEKRKNRPEKWEAPQPWTANCGNEECKVDEYTRDGSNTAMVHYADSKQCNFLYSRCPSCNFSLRVYVDDLDPEDANVRGYEVVDNERIPDDGIFEEWLKVKGHKMAETYELTQRHEKIVAHFGEVLRNCPDDLIHNGITTGGDRPYPDRWV